MMKQVFKRTDGLKDKEFHYCGGCLHSVVHRLIGEALEEMGLLDCSIASFLIMFLDCTNRMPSDKTKMGMANSRMLRLSLAERERRM